MTGWLQVWRGLQHSDIAAVLACDAGRCSAQQQPACANQAGDGRVGTVTVVKHACTSAIWIRVQQWLWQRHVAAAMP